MIPGKGRLQKHPVDLHGKDSATGSMHPIGDYVHLLYQCLKGRIQDFATGGGGAFTTGGAFAMMGLDVC